jgi:hypothetical protein
MQLTVQLALPLYDDLPLLLLLHLLFKDLLLELLESLDLVVALRKLLYRVLIFFLKEVLQVFSRDLRGLELVNFYLGQIDDLG